MTIHYSRVSKFYLEGEVRPVKLKRCDYDYSGIGRIIARLKSKKTGYIKSFCRFMGPNLIKFYGCRREE
jgi:hypothetical protein